MDYLYLKKNIENADVPKHLWRQAQLNNISSVLFGGHNLCPMSR